MNFAPVRILCVGDLMLDRYVYNDVERISPEAPVPVLQLKHTTEMLGGVGNVASNVAALGGQAVLIGLVGSDAAGASIRQIISSIAGITPDLVESTNGGTICKTRFIAGRQQILRFDEETRHRLGLTEMAAVRTAIAARLPHVNAIILSDYGKGLLTPGFIAEIVALSRRAGLPVFVDPKSSDFSHYRGVTCITPNLKELGAASGLPVSDEEEVVRAARSQLARADAAAILATRSEKGMVLVEASGEVHSVPSRAREVFDVSGAGDTVIATLALVHASGRPLSQAMHVANAAAAVVVSKFGTATADITEVLRELEAQEPTQDQDIATVLKPLSQAAHLVHRWKEQGLVVGFTNGCFDLLHPGHVSLLAQARRACDRLVVGLNSDASIRRLKGAARPVNALAARASVLAAIRHVDCIVPFEEDTPLNLIRSLLPHVLVKGADYKVDQVVGADLVEAAGGRVLLAKLVPEQSTTRSIARIESLVMSMNS